ncbi:MAG: peptide deformylase [Myxococcales bacterium]|nr:peptide deformylase [Myxococcales bacterium]
MAIRPIVTFPNPVLKTRCEPVTSFDEALTTLLDDMRDTMNEAEGLGLAANQVGVSLRIFTMGLPTGEDEDAPVEHFEIINPEIVTKKGEIRFEEGCLSFPGIAESVTRAGQVELRYYDRSGAEIVRVFDGVAAVCVQHEFDHLEGVTFLDRLSPLKRRLAMRAYKKAMAQARDDAEDEGRSAVRPWR